jgi:hypothetical protein
MMATRKLGIVLLGLAGILLMGLAAFWALQSPLAHRPRFDGERAYRHVLAQMAFGPRTPGSQAHTQTVDYIQAELERAGWTAQVQETSWDVFPVRNIVASRSTADPEIILGAHYDSRLLADQDPGPGRNEPVPGANDGASGVAVLLELARCLPAESIPVWLVFFDAEDNGGLDRRLWIMGSRAFAAALEVRPRAVVIVDMIGDADLNLYYEGNSDRALRAEIWAQAAALGYQTEWIPETRHSLLDDHIPFLGIGIPSVDIIDFDYPYWHTAADTADKVSARSLESVGRTLEAWLSAGP